MQIQIDTREKPKAIEKIIKDFDNAGIKYFKSKLYVGDYMSLDNAKLVIDRKQDLQELCSNVCQQHERFKAELVRALENDIKIVILCEHGKDIKSLEDVYFWQNPRKHNYYWATVNGKRVRKVASKKAVDGKQLYKSLCTIRDRYNVDFVFCNKEETGRKIIEILGGNYGNC